MAGAGNPVLTQATVVSDTSEIWVMPRQGQYDDALLKVYFTRLARRMKQRADARKQTICFETLINSVPDISWFKNVSGAHLIVNDSFCEMVGKTKEQIYKKGHCYIWDASKEDEEVCLSSDRIIMESRQTNIFEETVKTRTSVQLLKTYKSALIDVDGEIFGTCGIGHDITALRDMSTELDIVLDSVPFAIMVEDRHGVVMNKNSRFDEYFPDFTDILGKKSEEWRKSLSKKLLMDGERMEVVLQSGKLQRVLILEEEPILGALEDEIGKIVTLMDITLERSISKKNEHTANTDYLTGLNNRRGLMTHLENIFTRDDVALIMVDLDHFKQVNDQFGHEAGDRAITKAAEILTECFQDDFVARLGGDEFMVVTIGKSAEAVQLKIGHLLEVMRDEYKEQEEFHGVTASAGIIMTRDFSEEERNLSDLLEIVDEQLYQAKRGGRDRFCIYMGK